MDWDQIAGSGSSIVTVDVVGLYIVVASIVGLVVDSILELCVTGDSEVCDEVPVAYVVDAVVAGDVGIEVVVVEADGEVTVLNPVSDT